MTTEEANTIIAEYMGYDDSVPCGNSITNYLSLDALVPVWKKLEEVMCLDPREKTCTNMNYSGFYIDHGDFDAKAETLQAAAAIATAKCIQELTK